MLLRRIPAHGPRKIYDQVVEGREPDRFEDQVGPGMDPTTEMGPLVSDEQFSRVTGYINSGVEQGAQVLAGGKAAALNQETPAATSSSPPCSPKRRPR
jgi:acyl-CoA reductase-like NAD-dependent aldehyde dehydrogenase